MSQILPKNQETPYKKIKYITLLKTGHVLRHLRQGFRKLKYIYKLHI